MNFIFFNADYKKCCDFHLKNIVIIISFYWILTISDAENVQGSEKVMELFFKYLVAALSNRWLFFCISFQLNDTQEELVGNATIPASVHNSRHHKQSYTITGLLKNTTYVVQLTCRNTFGTNENVWKFEFQTSDGMYLWEEKKGLGGVEYFVWKYFKPGIGSANQYGLVGKNNYFNILNNSKFSRF